jgi:hypothetical protein
VLPFLKYTVLRLALFVLALGGLALLGAGPLLAVVGAAVISLLLSYLLLRGPREELSRAIAGRVQGRLADPEPEPEPGEEPQPVSGHARQDPAEDAPSGGDRPAS